MASMFESYGLGFIGKDEETFMGLSRLVAAEGKAIRGYYGAPYLFLPAGDAEFWGGTEKGEEGRLEFSRLHTHCAGNSIWEMTVSGISINDGKESKNERILMMRRAGDDAGMLPVDIINADVLPSFLKGDTVKLQVVAPCIGEVRYYETEDDYEDTCPADKRGKKWLIGNGALLALAFLANHSVDTYEPDKEYEDDHFVSFRATVKALYHGRFGFEEEKNNFFIRCIADTQYGELEFDHCIDQVPEEMRKNIRIGAVITGTCIISADAAIYEYEDGIVKDFDHDLQLLRFTMEKGEAERLRSVLTESSVYETDSYEKTFNGPDEIIDRFNYVNENSDGRYIAHLAEITQTDEENMEYTVGTKCIVLADKEHEDEYESIVFITTDEEGCISRIKVSNDSRYHFQIKRRDTIKTVLDDVKRPESVAELIMNRARFHELIDRDMDEKEITENPDYSIHKDNAERMLDALEKDHQPDIKIAFENVFGYLFAKSIEMTVNEEQANRTFKTELTASYSPSDAFHGELQSTFEPEKHESLLAEMDLGKQFSKDMWTYMAMTDADDSAFADTFKTAAIVVQRIGQIYAKNSFWLKEDN